MIDKKVHIDLCLKCFVSSDFRQFLMKRICIRKLHECENVLFAYKCVLNAFNALKRMLTVRIRVNDKLVYQ